MDKNNESTRTLLLTIRKALSYRFNLRPDQSRFADIDKNIRDGIEVRGTNLWVLMLAIFIASIGLNVNSTAVVIGAMLISPLMGPIMGVGYGVGINDYLLIRKSLGNLLVSILISLFTSTLYFLISPLSIAQSELLGRSSPTIWDVLIALFGGLAGIIATTRKEKSNVIAGVAIATALMPPLCTAGYGIANGSMKMFFGASYLFFINCVFIALATLLMVSYIKLPHKTFVSGEFERKVKLYIYIVVLATVLPSIYLAYGLVTRELFSSRANEFIKSELVFDNSFIAKQDISPEMKTIEITLVGKKVSEQRLAELSKRLPYYNLANAKLIVHQTFFKELNEASLKKSLLTEVLSANQETFDSKNKQIEELKNELSNLKAQQNKQIEYQKQQQEIIQEFMAQYPQVQKLSIAKTIEYGVGSNVKPSILMVHVIAKNGLSRKDRLRIVAWLKVRTGVDQVNLTIEAK